MTENLNRALDLLRDTIPQVPDPEVYARLREVERLIEGHLNFASDVYPSDRLLCAAIKINTSLSRRMSIPFEKMLSIELSNVRKNMLKAYRDEHSS